MGGDIGIGAEQRDHRLGQQVAGDRDRDGEEHTPNQRLPETPRDVRAELDAWARDHHKHLYRLRALIRTSMGEFEENPEQCKQAMCVSIRIANELTDYLTTAQRAGLIATDITPAAATAMLMGTLFADAMGRDPMPERYPYTMREGVEAYLHLFLRAIGATGGR